MNTPLTPRNKRLPFAPAALSIAARLASRPRTGRMDLQVHPVLTGDRHYLRALRAAEMAAWAAGLPASSVVELISATNNNSELQKDES